MNLNFDQQVVLVTGASRGIGHAVAHAFGEAGATVAAHYHSSPAGAHKIVSIAAPDSHAFQADLGNSASCVALAQAVLSRYGRVDVLVNNAGISLNAQMDLPWETWLERWNQTLQVNLTAAGLLCHQLLPSMVKQGGGRLIHIASRAAFRGDVPEYLAYAASKGGMVPLSRSIARYYGKQNIQSFVVAPGFIQTDMAQQFIDDFGENIVLKDLALPTLTQPEEVAPTVLFLASGHMDHATGCTIDINAGSYVR